MPTNITIKGIPDDVYKKLKKQAEMHHRSINSEVIVYLKKAVKSNPVDPKQIINQAKKLKKKISGSVTMDEIQDAINQGRS